MNTPGIIHMCWFGKQLKKPLVERCIRSWHDYAPEFRIKEWNEENCDISCCPFVETAYKKGLWAFVSDYFRIKALAEYGGVYLDTDMELKAPLAPWCQAPFAAAFELPNLVHVGFICVRPHHPLIQDLQRWYETRNGKITFVTLPRLLTSRIRKYYPGFRMDGLEQRALDGATLHPANRFTVDMADGHCVAEHHYEGSWKDRSDYGNTYAIKVRETYRILELSQSECALLRNTPLEAALSCCSLSTFCRVILKHMVKKIL